MKNRRSNIIKEHRDVMSVVRDQQGVIVRNEYGVHKLKNVGTKTVDRKQKTIGYHIDKSKSRKFTVPKNK